MPAENRRSQDCERYEAIVRRREGSVPTRAEFDFLEKHERECPGKHSEIAVEKALGLPCGGLRNLHPLFFVESVIKNPRKKS